MDRKNKTSGAGWQHTRHTRVIINLRAIQHNYQYLKKLAANSKVIAVIKADAYGHGAVEVANALSSADAFAVATVMEAVDLRQAGVQQKIIVLGGPIDKQEMQACAEYQLDPVIHQGWQIQYLAALKLKTLDIWLKFNSGMGRLGFSESDIKQALQQVNDLKLDGTIRLMTHLANADDLTDEKSKQQFRQTENLGLHQYEWGIANSAGILGWPQSRLNWVRTGIALYGSDPLTGQNPQMLKPAMQFSSVVIAINMMKKGQSIGYGGLYSCAEDQKIAVVAAGYADGYPRHLMNGFVVINKQKVNVVGRVSMDMITVDISGLDVSIGDEVILWGNSPLANEVARSSETISYELFCHTGCHARREYINV